MATVVAEATRIAARTPDPNKLDALVNACLQAAAPNTLSEQYELIFLRLLDELTPVHWQLLTYFADKAGWLRMNNVNPVPPGAIAVSAERDFAAALPALAGDREIANLTMRDLEARQLIRLPRDNALDIVWERALFAEATDLGLQFLAYLEPPWPEDAADPHARAD